MTLSSEDAAPIGSILKKYRDIRMQVADAALVHLAERDGLGHNLHPRAAGIFGVSLAEREAVSDIAESRLSRLLKGFSRAVKSPPLSPSEVEENLIVLGLSRTHARARLHSLIRVGQP